MKMLSEGFYTPGWNADWRETDGRRYYNTTNLQDEEKNGNKQRLKEDSVSRRNTTPDLWRQDLEHTFKFR